MKNPLRNLFMALALSFGAGCMAEPIPDEDPAEAAVSPEDGVARAPRCGGDKYWLEWQCVGTSWELVPIAEQALNCSSPFRGPIRGSTLGADCVVEQTEQCSGIAEVPCGGASSGCYTPPTGPCIPEADPPPGELE